MARWVAVLVVLPLSGCVEALIGGAVGTAAVAPGFIGMAGAKSGTGDGVLAMGYVHVGDDEDQDVEGGWGISLRSAGYVGAKRPVLYLQGRTEAGTFGRDRMYGFTGFDLGPGLRVNKAIVLGTGIGYRYGGYAQNGHAFPVRGAVFVSAGPVVVHGSVFSGWRVGVRDEYPEAEARYGPGWNMWGADVGFELAGKGGQGLSFAVTFDREDDIGTLSFHVGAALHPTASQ